MQQLHFAGLASDRHGELLARMAFLVTRGALPDVAYHAANDGMVLDEQEEENPDWIDWNVVKAVAAAWPDPARGPDARPVHGVLELARNIVGLVESTVEVPETYESNLDQLAGLCLSERMRRMVLGLFEAELARRRPEPEEPPPADEPDGAGWAPPDDDEPF